MCGLVDLIDEISLPGCCRLFTPCALLHEPEYYDLEVSHAERLAEPMPITWPSE